MSLQITRYLRPETIRLGLVHGHRDEIDPEANPERERERLKEAVMQELAELFDATGQIRNRTRFLKDLRFRESRGSTAVGGGVAVPHVRSMTPRGLALVFARSRDGVEYDAPDDAPVHIFFGIAAPEYEDRVFLQFYKWIAQTLLQEDWLPAALLAAEDEHEILGLLCGLQ